MEGETAYREDILKLHILYLENLEYLSKVERKAFEAYFNYLANPVITAGPSEEFENMVDKWAEEYQYEGE